MSSTLTSNERVFESLNCAKCQKPFSTDPSRRPREVWFERLRYICCECFDSEKVKKKEEPWKSIEDWGLQNVDTVKYLLELIADDSLQMNESNTGYIIAKEPFISPECPVCFEKYEIAHPMKRPFVLWCYHTVCIGCYHRMRIRVTIFFYFKIECPICQEHTINRSREKRENGLKNFLRELPEMIEQYKVTKALGATQSNVQCSACPKKIQSIINEYRERFAKMDQEFEERLDEVEKKLIVNMEKMK